MIERVVAWRCIGCGRIEASQPCIGVCQDRPVELVFAVEHEEAMAALRRRMESLLALTRQLAHTTPRAGEWERSYRALQAQARRTLAAFSAADAAESPPSMRESETSPALRVRQKDER